MEKNYDNLSKFANRKVELFRSSDLKNTAIYFTDLPSEDKGKATAFFELLRLDNRGDHQTYIRFPNEDHFVEMVGGGGGSGRGNMMTSGGKDVWETGSDLHFEIYSQEDNLLLTFGKHLTQFNFMVKVHDDAEVRKALSMKYLRIPEDVRQVEYLYKTKSVSPKYFVIDYPAYNFRYDNHRFRIIDNDGVKEYKIKNFERYRDGGTTIIDVVDENSKEHKFFSPTPFDKSAVVKWDDIELEEVADEKEKEKIIALLQLELEPSNAD